MKRSLKLRDAHKCDGSPALCSVLWSPDGRDLVTSSAAEPSILIHDASKPSKPAKELQYHKGGVAVLALSPGFIDNSVNIYTLPGIPLVYIH